MSELSKYLVEQILLEDENPIKKNVVVYVGRFQPMHRGHFAVYQHLVKKFGKDNVYVGTSDKVQLPKSPFNFKEKELIASKMYGIPKSKFIQVKNPYNPQEVLSKFDSETTSFTTVVSEKDKSRLGGKYFTPYTGETSQGYKDRGYVYVVPILGKGVSGTEVRDKLSSGTEKEKQDFFKNRVFGKFDKSIYNLITSKLNEGIFISKERIEEWMISEASNVVGNGGSDVDDGPNNFFPNFDVFSKINAKRAAKIGYEIVNMITSKELEDYYEHPTYPNGPTKSVTFFPAGVIGSNTPNNQVDIYSSGAYSKWYTHATRKASLVGYSIVSDPNMKDDKKQSGDDARGDKKLKQEFENSIQEVIELPVEIGDTLLMGKFKNKKVVVKSIGKDEHGLPTINGKKVVTFRYMNESFIVELAGTAIKCEKCNHSWEIEADDKEKYLCHSCGWDSQKQEYDYDAFDSWQEKNGILDEALSQAQRARKKWALARQASTIKRKRQRTMLKRKSIDKLRKIAYRKAYLEVYELFRQRLYPDVPKSDLTPVQRKQIEKWVLKKKRKVMKRARFVHLPQLRDAEAEKFKRNEDKIPGGLSQGMTLKDIAIKHNVQLSNLLDEFKKGYKVEREHTTDTDIAKEIAMDHLFEDPKYYTKLAKIEELLMGYPDQEWLDNHEKELHKLRKDFDNEVTPKSDSKYQYGVVVKEELEKLGITDFKSLFKKMPSELQKRVYNLKNFGQRLDKHPEGNVLKHTIVVVNRSLKDDDIDIAIAAMFHDIGKDETAGIHKTKGHITHFGHEKVSASLVSKYKDWIKSVGGNAANVLYIVKNHMRYKQLSDMRPVKQDRLKSFRAYDKLAKFSKHDRGGLGESVYNDLEKLKKVSKDVSTFVKRAMGAKELKHFKGDGAFETYLKSFYLGEISESLIIEGGAATGGAPIPAEYTMDMYNDVVKILSSTFKITKNDARPLGSTGKKKAGDFSGDIDIAVDAAKIGAKFKLKFDEVQDFMFGKLKGKFQNVVNMKGLGIISFLYPIPNSDKFGQTDIMLSDNLELSSFMFHSPNFIENESKYKGLYRNDLLFSIVKYLPTNIPDEYFEDGKDKGEIKKFTKHTLSQKKGLLTQLKSFEGKLGKTKNAKPVKGGEVQIANVPNDIVKYIFGPKYNVDDIKSFESLYKIILKSDFKHKKILPKVIQNFKDSILKKNLPLPSEIK